jgi:tetratricopeptide (TPR) repeat protein
MIGPAAGDKKNIVKMAYIYFQEGRWDKAIEEYKKLLLLDPEDINTHNMLGDVYVKKGSAREAFEEYLKVSNDFSTRGQADKAIIVNKKIAALDSSQLTTEGQKQQSLIRETIRAESAMESGNVDAAIEALSEVAKLDKDNLAAYSKLGELYEKKGLVPEAVKAYLLVADNFFKNRLFKKAQEIYQKVAQLQPTNLDARSNLAQIFMKQGSEGDAKKEFLVLAELALNTGDLERAQQNATRAIELKSIEAHYIQGVILFKKQQYSEAKSELENLLRFKVNHVAALSYLARVHMEQNQLDKANEAIQRAIKAEKDNPMVLEAQAELALKRGSKVEAGQAFKTLLDRAESKGDFVKAAEFARFIVSLDENSVPAIGKLGDMLKAVGDKKEAANTYFKNVLLLEKQGKKEEGTEWARKTLEMNPDHSGAQERIMGQVVAPAHIPDPKEVIPLPVPASAPPLKSSVLDLESSPEPAENPSSLRPGAGPPPTPAPAPVKASVMELEQEPTEDWQAELSIADNFIRQGMLEEAIEICQRLAENYPDKTEIRDRLNQAYQAYVKTGDDVIGALEAERRAKEEEEKSLRAEMEKKALEEAKRLRAELEQKARQEAEEKARLEIERQAKEEAERKAQEEIKRREKEEADRAVREEMEKRIKEEMESKIREEAQREIREEAEQKDREEAERKLREEIERKTREETERKIREEAEKKVQEELERKAREEAERKLREEMERKNREEAEKKVREEVERKAREEAEQRAREERDRQSREEAAKLALKRDLGPDLKSLKLEPSSNKGDSVLDEGKDDFMTIAVADIYTRQGLHEEAAKIYRRILENEPDNIEARKKLSEVERLLGPKVAAEPALPPPSSSPTPLAEHKEGSGSPPPGEKDSGGKRKSNRVGYV